MFTVAHITKIESVQRSFTKRLPGLRHLAYTKRLDVIIIIIHEYYYGGAVALLLEDHLTIRYEMLV